MVHELLAASLICFATQVHTPDVEHIKLVTPTGDSTTFGEALGSEYKIVVLTKPWVDANTSPIGDLLHYRIRLNKGGLRSAVIFVRCDTGPATVAMGNAAKKVAYYVDPKGRLARALDLKTLPSLYLLDGSNSVVFTAPLLSREVVRQLAKRYDAPGGLLQDPKNNRAIPLDDPGRPAGVGEFQFR
jgi:hypothetical protein